MKLVIQPSPVIKLTIQPDNAAPRSGVANAPLSIFKGDKGDPGLPGPQGPAGQAGQASTIKRDVIILNGTHISTKIVNLTSSPASDWVFLMPDKGIPQRAGIDFFLDRNDNTIKWMGMGLDGVLRVNDRLEIHYFI
jgi:hypothetical protein